MLEDIYSVVVRCVIELIRIYVLRHSLVLVFCRDRDASTTYMEGLFFFLVFTMII